MDARDLDPATQELIAGAAHKLSGPILGPSIEAARADARRRREAERILEQYQSRGHLVRPLSSAEIYNGRASDIHAYSLRPQAYKYREAATHRETLAQAGTRRRQTTPTADMLLDGRAVRRATIKTL